MHLHHLEAFTKIASCQVMWTFLFISCALTYKNKRNAGSLEYITWCEMGHQKSQFNFYRSFQSFWKFKQNINSMNACEVDVVASLPFFLFSCRQLSKSWWFLGVADTNDVIQKIEKTLNNTHTTTQKLTNNSFRNTKKHPKSL